jgi:predicted transcriptional regulator
MLQVMQRFGRPVTWSWLRTQFCLTSGALLVLVNSLKRHLLVEQDGLYYRLTSFGEEALSPHETIRQAFGGREQW